RAAVEARSIEPTHRLVRILRRRHLDEPEAARAPRVPIGDDAGGLDGAHRRECVPETIAGGGVGEAADEQFHGHERYSFLISQCTALNRCSRQYTSFALPTPSMWGSAGARASYQPISWPGLRIATCSSRPRRTASLRSRSV